MTLAITALASALMSLLAMGLADHFLRARVAILGSFVGLVPAQNPGIAFSIQFAPLVQSALILIALGLVTILAIRTARTVWARIAFGLIIGGAIGNIIDRLIDGSVTDYFQVGTFPIFNLADSCITIGVVLLLCLEIMHALAQRKEQV